MTVNAYSQRGHRLLRLTTVVGIIVSAIALIVVLGDLDGAGSKLADVRWTPLTVMILVAIASYSVRFARWHRLLSIAADVTGGRWRSFVAFATGGLLIFTPGRVGEAAKSVYARELSGIPMSSSLPVILAERINDVAVMLLLAVVGLLLFGATGELSALLMGLAALVAVALGLFVLFRLVIKNVSGPGPFGIYQFVSRSRSSVVSMLGRRALTENVIFGLIAWLLEVVVFYLAMVAVGEPWSVESALIALAIYPAASLAGALSMLPAGIGVTEGGLAGLAVAIGGIDGDVALAATVLARAVILGTVVLIGLTMLPVPSRLQRSTRLVDQASTRQS
ncbi:MAG: flippase-like domain-containing protein [Chloroflexi bacterium]|nr:flippase-like domain-containing protein [Chloroflexota bacterium]